MTPRSLPAFLGIIGGLRQIARSLGYVVAVHGSLDRDIDLVAVPWTEHAASKEDLLTAICYRIGGQPSSDGWRKRLHGRWVHIVKVPRYSAGPDAYLDFSVMEHRKEWNVGLEVGPQCEGENQADTIRPS